MDSGMQQEHISSACFQSSPVHIRAVAHLYGVETVPVERARVLELGCEAGGNLLPFVLAHPEAQAVGVDLSQELIASGHRVVQDLNIANLRLHAIDPSNLDRLGEFDYILVRGIFSGIAEAGRKELLHICRNMLSPKGVLYFQYSTYPGAKLEDVVRDAALMHGHTAETQEQKLGSVRAVLSLLSDGVAASNSMMSALQEVVTETKGLSDHVLIYKYLQGLNASCYFLEFVDAAREAGMAYVGDAEPQTELPVSYGPNVQLNTSLMALGQPRVMRQQYLDFSAGRKLRRSLLVPEEREAEIFSAPDFSRLADLNWAASYRTAVAVPGAPAASVQYMGKDGESFSCNDKLEISIIDALSQAWPYSLSFEALKMNVEDILSASMRKDSQEEHIKLQNAMESLFRRGVLRYSLGPGPYDICPNDRLSFIPGLAYTLGLVGKASIRPGGYNLWHQSIDYRLDDVESSALPLLNGTKSFQQMTRQLDRIVSEMGAGEAQVAEGVSAPTSKLMSAEKRLARLIDILKQQGALLGSSAAWVSYFRKALAIYSTEGYQGLRYVGPIVLYSSQKEIGGLGASILPNKSNPSGKHSATDSNRSIISEAERKIRRLMEKRQFSDAQAVAWKIAQDMPDQASSWELLCKVLLGTAEQPKEALVPLLRAIALRPKASYCHSDLGLVLRHQGLLKEAEASVRRALRLDPGNDKAWLQLGMAVSDNEQQNEAEFCYRYALTLKPDNAHAHNNLANVCANQQHMEEAISHYRRAIEIQPNLLDAHSNLLFTLTHDESIGANELFKEHRSFGLLMEKAVGRPDLNYLGSRMRGRRLRVGFVSADLRNHAVAHFIEPVWRELDKDAFEIHAYSNSLWEDGVSARLRTYTAAWRQVSNLDDLSLAQRIRDDGIDILFDLSGHSAKNRLAALAYRPAPIQVSWIGYPGTTGLQAVDYYMIGKDIAPIGLLDEQFTEKLVYLPSSVRFEPAEGSPKVNPLPALENDTFTFASFNRPGKLGKAMIALWAEVLAAVPHSKLLLGNILGKATSEALQAQFLAHGVASERLIFCERVPLLDYLQMHHRVDLLLDTVPYAGGTTTCHGLWMGVPTLTLAGETLAGRQGVALMKQFGLDQFVALSKEDYVNKAVALSRNLEELASIRTGLRRIITNHYATPQVGMARCVEVAMQRMWGCWSNGESPASFTVEM